MDKILRVLNIEDSQQDADLLTRHLTAAGYELTINRVDTAKAMKKALASDEWDIVLCDYSMPRFNALLALNVLHESGIDIPFIIISGTVGEVVAVEAMLTGAHDYVSKENLTRLVPAIEREIKDAAIRRQLRRAEEDRRATEGRYRTLFEYAPDGIIISSPDKYYLDANPSMCKLLGYTHAELVGMHASDIVIQAEIQFLAPAMEAINASFDHNEVWHFRRKDNSVFEGDVLATLMPDGNLLAVIRDISERTLAEVERTRSDAELQEKSALLEAQLNSSIDGILVVDASGRKVIQNQQLVDMLQIPQDIADDDDDNKQVEWVTGIMKDPEKFIEKVIHLYSHPTEVSRDEIELKNGSILDRYSAPVLGKDNKNYGRIWTFRDMTERKRADQAIRESETRLRAIIDTEPECLKLLDADGNLLEMNPAGLAMVEADSFSDIANKTVLGLISEEYWPAFRDLIAKVFRGETATLEFEIVGLKGTHRWLDTHASPLRDASGSITSLLAITRDVTERKLAEKARLSLERKYQNIFTFAPVGIYQSSPDGILTTVNEALSNMLGYASPEELKEKNLEDVYFNQDERRKLVDRYEARGYATDVEIQWKRNDGSPIWIQLTAHAIKGSDGITDHFEGFVRDVTQSRIAEDALRESNEKFHQLADNITDVFWIRSLDLKETYYVSPGFETIWGRTRESLYAHPEHWIEFILPEDRGRVMGAFAALTEDATGLNLEYRITRPDGEIRWIDVRGFPVRDEAGKLIRYAGIVTDITDRKRADDALVQSEERYRDLVENAIDIIYTLDLKGNYISVNQAVERITGYTQAETLAMNVVDIVHPADLENAKQILADSLAGGGKSEYQLQILAKSGIPVTIEITSSLIVEDEVPVGIQGIARDITDRKAIEYELQRQEKELRALFDYIPAMVCFKDTENGILRANKRMADILGMPVEQIEGQSSTAIFPNEAESFYEDDLEVINSGYPKLGIIETIRDKDGKLLYIQTDKVPVFDLEGRVTGIIAMSQDISDRLQVETQLRFNEQRYRSLVQATTAIVWDTPASGEFEVEQASWSNFTGQPFEELKGWGWLNAIHPDDRLETSRVWSDAVASHRTYEVEHRLLDRHGNYRDMAVRAVPILDDHGSIHQWIGVHTDITERKKSEAAVHAAEEKYRSIFENALEGIFQSTPDGRFISVNPSFAHMLGFKTPADMIEHRNDIATQHYVDPNSRPLLEEMLKEQEIVVGFEAEVFCSDGSKIWTSESMRSVRDDSGNLIYYEGSVGEITERKLLEEQLRQSQKMEAVGVLAGGIAHDFNNLLTAINGYSDLTLRRMPTGDPLRRNIVEVKKAGDRAAELTGQLLAFSRKQVLKPVVHSVNSIISNIEKMLRRIIKENIELRTVLDPQLANIKADPGQIEQVIMNLSVNARDAMPAGGTLTVETRNVYLDEEYVSQHLNIAPGLFVRMTVTDTGSGIAPSTQQHMFEPFFTTKEVGKGTGLGLSTVYGIVKQSGGDIMVYSEIGHGTTFKLYFPAVDDDVERPRWAGYTGQKYAGTETILLVEDEELVRNLVREILTGNGYKVLEAGGGMEALSLCESYAEPIHMLLTDVIMPKMGGAELKDKIVTLMPAIKVLFMSGYTDDSFTQTGMLSSGTAFIEKPFTPDALARKIREVFET